MLPNYRYTQTDTHIQEVLLTLSWILDTFHTQTHGDVHLDILPYTTLKLTRTPTYMQIEHITPVKYMSPRYCTYDQLRHSCRRPYVTDARPFNELRDDLIRKFNYPKSSGLQNVKTPVIIKWLIFCIMLNAFYFKVKTICLLFCSSNPTDFCFLIIIV